MRKRSTQLLPTLKPLLTFSGAKQCWGVRQLNDIAPFVVNGRYLSASYPACVRRFLTPSFGADVVNCSWETTRYDWNIVTGCQEQTGRRRPTPHSIPPHAASLVSSLRHQSFPPPLHASTRFLFHSFLLIFCYYLCRRRNYRIHLQPRRPDFLQQGLAIC